MDERAVANLADMAGLLSWQGRQDPSIDPRILERQLEF
jgi:hypothetical protein